jgi:hypothetical protein
VSNFDVFLIWYDSNPVIPNLIAGILITLALFKAVIPFLKASENPERTSHDWAWTGWIFAILIAGRWASLFFGRELNPDEGQLIAGAHTLLHDPLFWRSVDGGTAGPLDFYALWPAGMVCGWHSYLTARLTALFLLGLTLTFAHQVLSLLYGRRTARLILFPMVTMEAVTSASDFLHYSTELVPIMLFTVAGYACLRSGSGKGISWHVLGAILLGGIPFAKLQAAPLGVILGLGWLIHEIRLRAQARAFSLIAAALLPSLAFITPLLLTGEFDSALIPYLYDNLNYTSSHNASLVELLQETYRFVLVYQDPLLLFWFFGTLLLLLVLGVSLPWSSPKADLRPVWIASVLVLTSCYCILLPARIYLHYWQLLIVPLAFLITSLLPLPDSPAQKTGIPWSRMIAALLITLLVVCMAGYRLAHPTKYQGTQVYLYQNPQSVIPKHIRQFARPGDSITVWGWTNFIYVETGLPQGGRDSSIARVVANGPYREYYRQRFLADLVKNQPRLFVDSIGALSFAVTSSAFRHEQEFPALADVIRNEYEQVFEHGGVRLYVRKETSITAQP